MGNASNRPPGGSRVAQAENELKQQILDYLELRGHTVWNTNQGRIRGKYRMGKAGAPDIQGFSSDGHYIGIEVKTHRGKLRPEQREFRRDLQHTACGIYVEARDLNDVRAAGL